MALNKDEDSCPLRLY